MWIRGKSRTWSIGAREIDVYGLWSSINIFARAIRGENSGRVWPHDSQRFSPNLSTFGCSYPHKIATYPHLYVERGCASLRLSRHNQADWRLAMIEESEKRAAYGGLLLIIHRAQRHAPRLIRERSGDSDARTADLCAGCRRLSRAC